MISRAIVVRLAILSAIIGFSLLVWSSMAGSSLAAPEYLLPIDSGTPIYVTQGNNTPDHSAANGSQYAFDFAIVGSHSFSTLAVRGGKVIGVRTDSTVQCRDSNERADGTSLPDCWKQANYVLVDQGDGTSALYMHLQSGSPAVQVNQEVSTGQVVGSAGSTGWSTGIHLHFQVEKTPSADAVRLASAGWWWTSSVPVAFSDRDVLSKNPDGVPTSRAADNPYKSDNSTKNVTPATASGSGVIAYIGVDGRSIWAVSPDGSGNKKVMDTGARVEQIAWSPDGKTLAYLTSSGQGEYFPSLVSPVLQLIDVASGHARQVTTDKPIRAIAFFPEGNRLAAISDVLPQGQINESMSEILSVDLTTGATSHLINSYSQSYGLAVASNGQELYVGANAGWQCGSVRRLTVASGGPSSPSANRQDAANIEGLDGSPIYVDFSRDGRRTAYTVRSSCGFGATTSVVVQDATTPGFPPALFKNPDRRYLSATLSPDGQDVAAAAVSANDSSQASPSILFMHVGGRVNARVPAQGSGPAWQPVAAPIIIK